MRFGRALPFALLVVLLASPVLPVAQGAPPRAHDTAQATGTAEVSDLALDPTGTFAVAVEHQPATSTLPTSCPLGLCGGTPVSNPPAPIVWACDFGASSQGCRSVSHSKTTSVASTQQAVSVTSYQSAQGLAQVYAIAGPGDLISYYSASSATPNWEVSLSGSLQNPSAERPAATNVSIAPDGQHVLVGTTTTGSAGGLLLYYDAFGTQRWAFALVDAAQNPTHATSLAWSRNGAVVAIGTTSGLEILQPSETSPSSSDNFHPFNTTPVNEVAISAGGDVIAAATQGYTYYVRVDPATRDVVRPVYSRQALNGADVGAVAMSLDGERFASASGSRISFFHATHNSAIAQFDGEYDAGVPVTDLSYDGTGRLLVAAAGANVLGFSPDRTTPIWTLDAAAAGVGTPVRRVKVADAWYNGVYHPVEDAARVVVAGRTNVAAFDVVESATAALLAPSGTAIAPNVAIPLQLNVRNTGSLTDNFSFVVQPPLTTGTAPWIVSGASPVRLAPDESASVWFNLTAPPGQTPGTYPVSIEVHAAGFTGRGACANPADALVCPTLNLTLARSVVLTVGGSDEKRLLKQGAEDTVKISVTNSGNALGIVNLTATQTLTRGSQWPLDFKPARQLQIAPGQTVNVDVVYSAPNDAVSGDRNLVTVYAKEGEVTAMKNFTAFVDAVFGSELNATNSSLQLLPGEERTLTLNVHNTGNTEDLYNLTYSIAPASANNTDWRVVLAKPQVSVPIGQIRPVALIIKPLVAQPRDATLTLTATSTGDPAGSQSSFVIALSAKPVVTSPTSKGNFLPAPSPLMVLGLVAVAALARRLGGRRE